jgi:wobble nucleotide-excising tRNase
VNLKNRERGMKSSTALIDYAKSAAASSTAIVVASEPVVKKRTFNDLIMAGEHTKVNAAAATSAASALRPLRC